MTTLDMIDTAVKVGLGAVIGGIFTYLVAKLNHDKEMEKDRLRRRRALLENVATKCDNFSKHCRDYWALMADWIESNDPDKKLPKHRKKISESEQQFYEAFHDLTSAEGRLLLLGEKSAQAKLRSYGEYAQAFYSEVSIKNASNLDKNKMDEYRQGLMNRYKSTVSALSVVYGKNK